MTNASYPSGLPHPVADARFYAGVPGRRLLAFLIDTVAIIILSVVATLLFGLVTLGAGFFMGVPIMAAAAFVYRATTLAHWSATPGMWMTGIEMRRRDGSPFELLDGVLHTAGFMICLATGILQIISVATMALAPRGQGLPDMILGSAAINRPV